MVYHVYKLLTKPPIIAAAIRLCGLFIQFGIFSAATLSLGASFAVGYTLFSAGCIAVRSGCGFDAVVKSGSGIVSFRSRFLERAIIGLLSYAILCAITDSKFYFVCIFLIPIFPSLFIFLYEGHLKGDLRATTLLQVIPITQLISFVFIDSFYPISLRFVDLHIFWLGFPALVLFLTRLRNFSIFHEYAHSSIPAIVYGWLLNTKIFSEDGLEFVLLRITEGLAQLVVFGLSFRIASVLDGFKRTSLILLFLISSTAFIIFKYYFVVKWMELAVYCSFFYYFVYSLICIRYARKIHFVSLILMYCFAYIIVVFGYGNPIYCFISLSIFVLCFGLFSRSELSGIR